MTEQTSRSVFVFVSVVLTIVQSDVLGSSSANEINYMQRKRSNDVGGNLYPQASATRDLRTLDGIWNFRKSPTDPQYGYRKKWYENDLEKTGPVIPMPVPASYNDVGEEAALRDHVGLVWYDRRFHVPPWWVQAEQRIWLRFSSVHYAAQVWVNGKAVTYHEIGHLPFEVEITEAVNCTSNLLTVAVDNTLLSDTVPQGSVKDVNYNNVTYLDQSYTFDFFNYAGIHRSVFLYSTPQVYIDDVIVNTDVQGIKGLVIYNITFKGATKDGVQCLVQLYDKNDTQVVAWNYCAGILKIPNANFWWPYLMDPNPGYLYTLKYWVDFKGKLKRKCAAIRTSRSRTGGGPSDVPELSEIENKYLIILGEDFGAGLPGVQVDPFPQSDTNALTEDSPSILIAHSPLESQQVNIEVGGESERPREQVSHSATITVETNTEPQVEINARTIHRRRHRHNPPYTQEAARRALVNSSQQRVENETKNSQIFTGILQVLTRIADTLERMERR